MTLLRTPLTFLRPYEIKIFRLRHKYTGNIFYKNVHYEKGQKLCHFVLRSTNSWLRLCFAHIMSPQRKIVTDSYESAYHITTHIDYPWSASDQHQPTVCKAFVWSNHAISLKILETHTKLGST